jgi:hypothetical protein
MEEGNITPGLEACCNHEVCRRDLSQGMRCTQTCATTQSEQRLMVPIEAPPFSGLHVKYNISELKRNDFTKRCPLHPKTSGVAGGAAYPEALVILHYLKAACKATR